MQKKIITISRFHIAAVLFFVVGVFFFGLGIIRYNALQNAVTLEDLTIEELSKGVYIRDEVETVAGVYYDNNGKQAFLGGALHYINVFLQSYVFYTVPVSHAKDEFLTVMVPEADEKKWEALREVDTDRRVLLVGRVTGLMTNPNIKHLKLALSADTEEELAEKISLKYAILPVNEKKEKLLWVKGLSMMATGVLLWCIGNWRRGYLTVSLKNKKDGNEKGNQKKNIDA